MPFAPALLPALVHNTFREAARARPNVRRRRDAITWHGGAGEDGGRAAISAVAAAAVTARGVKRASKSIFPLSEERRVREPSVEGGETIR